MVSPQFVEEHTVPIATVKRLLEDIEKRDGELSYRSAKSKEFIETFHSTVSEIKSEDLKKKLLGLDLVRLKEEHITKIVDFSPQTVQELKVVLQAYPLSLPKKDQESIVAAVKETLQ